MSMNADRTAQTRPMTRAYADWQRGLAARHSVSPASLVDMALCVVARQADYPLPPPRLPARCGYRPGHDAEPPTPPDSPDA